MSTVREKDYWYQVIKNKGLREFNRLKQESGAKFLDLSGLELNDLNMAGIDLTYCNLKGCVFDYSTLAEANFSGSNIQESSFKSANLLGAKLSGVLADGADFCRAHMVKCRIDDSNMESAKFELANLYKAHVSNSYFKDSKFVYVNLCGASMNHCDLKQCDLTRTDLRDTSFYNSTLTGTCLDPESTPNGLCEEFERDGEYVIGYRTKLNMDNGTYEPGEVYRAPVFSISDLDVCHPGLYLAPSIEWLDDNGYKGDLVKVWAKPEMMQKSGVEGHCKWRTKCFFKVEAV